MATLIDSKRLSLVKATVALKFVKESRLPNSGTRINGSKLTCFKPLICQLHQLCTIRIQKERLLLDYEIAERRAITSMINKRVRDQILHPLKVKGVKSQ